MTLIQSQARNAFFDLSDKSWKSASGEATLFCSSIEALRACMRFGLSGVQLVVNAEKSPASQAIVRFDEPVQANNHRRHRRE
jgi:hypothetical protein